MKKFKELQKKELLSINGGWSILYSIAQELFDTAHPDTSARQRNHGSGVSR